MLWWWWQRQQAAAPEAAAAVAGSSAARSHAPPPRPLNAVRHAPPACLHAVKHCVKLRESGKYRQEVGSALISGADLVAEVAALSGAPLRALVGLDDAQMPGRWLGVWLPAWHDGCRC